MQNIPLDSGSLLDFHFGLESTPGLRPGRTSIKGISGLSARSRTQAFARDQLASNL